jgi:SAM-dependent methyltransferase
MLSFFGLFAQKKSNTQEQSNIPPPTSAPPSPPPVPYALPNNPQEINRLDFQHYMLRYVLEANYLAPLVLEQVNTMLDVGCGTGRWIYEMAQQFPHSRLIGIDHVLPDANLHFPPTCTFQQSNVLNGIPFPDHQFDYVHQRLLVLAFPLAKWPFVLHELVRVTRPGAACKRECELILGLSHSIERIARQTARRGAQRTSKHQYQQDGGPKQGSPGSSRPEWPSAGTKAEVGPHKRRIVLPRGVVNMSTNMRLHACGQLRRHLHLPKLKQCVRDHQSGCEIVAIFRMLHLTLTTHLDQAI